MHPLSRLPALLRVSLTLPGLAGAVLASSPVSALATDLKTFTDKSAYLAETGGIPASGPLPDLGLVASATVGSVTFSIAPGGDNLAIGPTGTGAEPDWYVPLPGNDIALGYENLQVDFAAPVYSLGFDFAQPDATMPFFGGVPQDSTFEVTLYDGPVLVGQVQFSSIPTDVVAFLGVWSSAAFTTATIIDITPTIFIDDDEFFGEFYSSDQPYAAEVATPCSDKAAFLRLPGVTSASGPIPNIGATSGAKLGSVTLSIAPGGNTLALGAFGIPEVGDWSPLLPGNDIAMGYEALEIAMDAPVTYFGIDFIEPDLTLPDYGGVPVPSTYSLELISGTTSIATLLFSGQPTDAATFLGACSSVPFDRVRLIDITPSPFFDDNEYFGEIYTGPGPVVWTNLGSALLGSYGEPLLFGTGPLLPGSSGALELSGLLPNSLVLLSLSFGSTPVPLFCGTALAWPPSTLVGLPTDSLGNAVLPWSSWPLGLSGVSLYAQAGVLDSAAVCGVALSNALRLDVP